MSEAERIAEIAKGLTRVRREALLRHRRHQAWGGRGEQNLPSWPEAGHNLRMLSLIEFVSETSSMTEVSDIGHRVRSYLETTP